MYGFILDCALGACFFAVMIGAQVLMS